MIRNCITLLAVACNFWAGALGGTADITVENRQLNTLFVCHGGQFPTLTVTCLNVDGLGGTRNLPVIVGGPVATIGDVGNLRSAACSSDLEEFLTCLQVELPERECPDARGLYCGVIEGSPVKFSMECRGVGSAQIYGSATVQHAFRDLCAETTDAAQVQWDLVSSTDLTANFVSAGQRWISYFRESALDSIEPTCDYCKFACDVQSRDWEEFRARDCAEAGADDGAKTPSPTPSRPNAPPSSTEPTLLPASDGGPSAGMDRLRLSIQIVVSTILLVGWHRSFMKDTEMRQYAICNKRYSKM